MPRIENKNAKPRHNHDYGKAWLSFAARQSLTRAMQQGRMKRQIKRHITR